jgi:hypothetical protein
MYQPLAYDTVGPWRCLRFSGALSFLSFIALGVAMVFLALFIHELTTTNYDPATVPSPNVTLNCTDSLVADNTTCALSTDCLQGLWDEEDDTCAYHPRSTSVTQCSSPCYSPGTGLTQCNGAGQCVGDRDACYGTCEISSDCILVNKFDMNEKLVGSAAYPSLWPYTSWYEPYGCWYGQCIGAILEIRVGSSEIPIRYGPDNVTYNFTALAANNECEDYLMPAFVTAYSQCLSISRQAIASSMVDYSEFGGLPYGNDTLPFQLSVCIYRFTCGVSSEDFKKKRSASPDDDHVYVSPEARGFTPASPAARNPLGDTASPRMQNAFWAKTEEVVKRGIRPFMNHVLKTATVFE